MKTSSSQRFGRFLALLLCFAMLLPMLPSLPAKAVDTAAAQKIVDQVRGLYSGGTKSNSLALDCGNGLTGAGEKSYMTIVTGTTATHFSNFQKSLKSAGYQVKGEWTIKSNSSKPNSFGSYLSPDGNFKVYTYFLPDYSETRIIVDTQKDTVEGYKYESQTGKTVEPKLVLWGLSMSETGYSTGETVDPNKRNQRNCGAMVVIRMPDNSLFIHDGGDVQQWNDQSCDDFVAFCRELTGTPEGEKMVVNTWFLSHAHEDHYRGFYRMINKKHSEFDLKNVMYTIDKERSGVNFDITGLLALLRDVYPGVRYYKPHTGEKIDIAGVTLDVIYTLEDRFIPNSSNKLIIDTDNKGGTYRDGLYKNSSTQTYDFNDTTTVIRMTFANGVNTILYGDATRAKTIYKTIYPTSFLKTDIMMVPHHGHNEHADLVSYADSKVYLYTQHKGAAYGPDNDVSTEDMYRTYHEIVKSRFVTMFPGMNVPAGTEKVDYDIFWGGSETVTIDINTLGKVIKGTSTAKYYTSQPAPNYGYTGWDVTDLSSEEKPVFASMENLLTEAAKQVTTTTIRFNPVASGKLQDNGRYIIKHKATNTVMSYEAVAQSSGTPNKATSLWPTSQDNVDSSKFDQYYESGKGIYMDHSNRAVAMWILNQEGTATDATLATGPLAALYGGKAYGETWLNKGNAAEFDSNGNKTAGRNGVYWHATYGQDGDAQYRFLDTRYTDDQWVKTSAPTGTDSKDPKKRYVIEDLGNGDFLIYWRSNSGDTVCFLTCDEYGNWGVKKFTNSTSDLYPSVPKKGSAALENLKLNLYLYKSFSDLKSVQFTGYKEFHVIPGSTLNQVVAGIQSNISVVDSTRHGLGIPCSGTTAQIGSYYLKFNASYDPLENKTYKVTVLFRNDDNTDTTITTLSVTVDPEAPEVEEPIVPDVPDVPETTAPAPTVPETTAPAPTVPETTAPAPTVPETTAPAPTVPETTAPAPTVPETTAPAPTVPETTAPAPTVPETTAPAPTVPETTAPAPTVPETTAPAPTVPETTAPAPTVPDVTDPTIPEATEPDVTEPTVPDDEDIPTFEDQTTESAVTVTTTTIRFNPVASGKLLENGRYIIKHKKTNMIMSYNALAQVPGVPNQATSFRPATGSTMDSSDFNVYYETSKGVYLEHSNRDLAMWILHQEGTSKDSTLATGPLAALYGGKAYGETWFNKGNATEYDADGNKTAGRNGVYWTSVYGNDGPSQYRYLDPRYTDDRWMTTSEPTGDDAKDPKKRYIIEDLGNGDFLIYWRSNSGATVCFLTCDDEGNWGIKKYTNSTTDSYPSVPKAGSAELENLKLKLYVYKNFTDKKNVQFSGYKTFNVEQGTSFDQTVSLIQSNISLIDTTRRGFGIRCSGTTAKIGNYYLKFNTAFNPNVKGKYTVTVMFRNDDNTDTKITTLTVNVV